MKETVLKIIKENNIKNVNKDQLILKLKEYIVIKNINKIIDELIEDSEIFFDSKGMLLTRESANIYKCKIAVTKKGFGFAIREDNIDGKDEAKPDIFIPNNRLMGAIHNDDVLVQITSNKEGESPEGRVIKILSRNTKTVVGTLDVFNSKYTVICDDERFSSVSILRSGIMGAVKGDKVVARIDYEKSTERHLIGYIVEVLGRAGNIKVEQLSIIRSYNLKEEFNEETIKEANSMPKSIADSALGSREDFRNLKVITVDGEDTRDIDDAISVEKTETGYRLGVHIADVSNYVKPNTAIDKEAYRRGTSVYFPNQVLPMLPRELSNGICSLNQGENRFTLSCIIDLDENCRVKRSRVCEGMIKSLHRMTYTEVQKIFDNKLDEVKEYQDVFEEIKMFKYIASKLKEQRGKRGEIRFDIPEPYIIENGNGEIVSIEKRVQDESHEMIESLMILCNECVAETFFKKKAPFVYRVHEKPDEIKMDGFKRFAQSQNLMVNIDTKNVKPSDFQAILSSLEGDKRKSAIDKITLRSMMKARYSPDCLGHFGLASTFYCHFTSPIRRYPDLLIHRIIKQYLHRVDENRIKANFKNFVFQASEQASLTEKVATEAERTVDDYKKALFMSNFIGQDFKGTISGVTEVGVFVELENTVEGLIRACFLPNDNYLFDKDAIKLIGTHHSYCLGDSIDVVCSSTDIKARQVDFKIKGLTEEDYKNSNIILVKGEKSTKKHFRKENLNKKDTTKKIKDKRKKITTQKIS